MITREIIVAKPTAVIPFQTGFVPTRHTPVTQEEFIKQVDHYSFENGDFVTMAPLGMCTSLFNVHCVTFVQKDFTQCFVAHGKPAPYLLCQVKTAVSTPWVRWDSPQSYRLLTAKEYDALIGNESDNIRYNCYEQSKYLIPNSANTTSSPV